MSMKRAIVILVLACCVFSFSEKDRQDHPFDWLVGTWTMNKKDGVLSESWKREMAGYYAGESIMTKPDGKTVPLETIKIFKKDNHYIYMPLVPDQNFGKTVEFRITSLEKSGFVAENPDHDFPKRISYKLITADSLHAWIDDGRSVPLKRSDFYYSRQKN